MRAAIYTRVSTVVGGSTRSVTEQEADCQECARREHWEVVKAFCDNDRSASRYAKKERPAYRQLQEYIAQGLCDVLVTWENSRAQRDLEDYVRLRELCRKYSVLWCYSGRIFDLSRTDDRLTTGLDALLSERESDVTRDRILRAMRANAGQGRPHGKLLYGYAREYDSRTGALVRQVVREDQAEIIREAARRVLSGESCNAIAKELNNRGVPPARSGRWDLTRVRRMVTNPSYAAKRIYKGEVVGEGNWPAILDESTLHQCCARMSDPSRKTTNEHSVKYLLSGIARCGVCDSTLKVMPQRGGYKSYTCRNFCVARKLTWLDELVQALILKRLSQPDALLLFSEQDGNAAGVLEKIAEKRARLDEFYDSAANGEITPSALGRIEGQLLSAISGLEASLRRFDVPTVLYDLAKAPPTVWEKLTLEQKREVVRCLLSVRVHRTLAPRGTRQFDLEAIQIDWRGSDEDDRVVHPSGQEQRQSACQPTP